MHSSHYRFIYREGGHLISNFSFQVSRINRATDSTTVLNFIQIFYQQFVFGYHLTNTLIHQDEDFLYAIFELETLAQERGTDVLFGIL